MPGRIQGKQTGRKTKQGMWTDLATDVIHATIGSESSSCGRVDYERTGTDKERVRTVRTATRTEVETRPEKRQQVSSKAGVSVDISATTPSTEKGETVKTSGKCR